MMDIVKKNLVSIICGAVALLALGAYFWPLGAYQSELQVAADEQLRNYRSISSLVTGQRRLPAVNPDSSEQLPLERFPNETIIARGQELQKQLKAESQQMLKTAVQMNRRELLVAGSLPSPSDATAYTFRDKYLKMLAPGQNRRFGELVTDVLQANTPPSAEEIAAEKKLMEAQNAARTQFLTPSQQQEMQAEMLRIDDVLKQRRATECKLYIEPNALDVNQHIAGRTAPNAAQIWNSQLVFWIQWDVAQAIAAANQNSRMVAESPVKHLLRLSIPPTFVKKGESSEASLPNVPSVSPTGRVSNRLYDVVHFALQMNVEASRLGDVLGELSRNRFITVLQMDVLPVDSGVMATKGYAYGPNPVVQVTLQCETLLFREWTKPLMPLVIQQQYGIAAAPQG